MAYVKERYFQCPQCNDTRVVHDTLTSITIATRVYCHCKGAHGFRVQMQEITAAQYHSGSAKATPSNPAAQRWPPQNYKCHNCNAVMSFDLNGDRMFCRCGNFVTAQWWKDNVVKAAAKAKQPQGYHYDIETWDDIGPSWAAPRPAPPKQVRKCSDCGQDTTNVSSLFGTVLCDSCAQLMFLRMTQMFQYQRQNAFNQGFATAPPKKKVIWSYCNGCGDLLPAYGGLHRCPMENNPLLTVVEFEEETMTPVTNVRVWWDPSVSAYRLASPFNKDLVEAIKTSIPISDRSFDPQTKIWTFVERQLAPVQNLFKMLNVQATIITRQQAEQASQSTPQGPRRGAAIAEIALEFMRVAGPDAMQKAYRAAAMSLHPDRGGSMDKMSALNAAWERLQKEVYGQ